MSFEKKRYVDQIDYPFEPSMSQGLINCDLYPTCMPSLTEKERLIMTRLFCPRCGAKILNTDNFCSQCGSQIKNSFNSTEGSIVKCAACKGTGKIRDYNPPFGYIEEEKNICPACDGSGVQRV